MVIIYYWYLQKGGQGGGSFLNLPIYVGAAVFITDVKGSPFVTREKKSGSFETEEKFVFQQQK